ERIALAGGDPEKVSVIAVTKGFGADAGRTAVECGLVDLGENYAQELLTKAEGAAGWPVAPRWHFIGAIQRNKVRALASRVHLWHTVARAVEGEEIARFAPGARVLVQVDLVGRSGRNGAGPEEVAGLVAAMGREGLDVRGLMTVGPPGPPESARPVFRRLAGMAGDLGLPELSMGMTADLEVAVQEGATMIRVGEGLFGPRPPRRTLRQ
ncbi:MAG: YggS family pyridoxal phosphate enzyme, partial [Acidimicrobiales bacterium]|nr:YggS family pyridoxal phosphate enzyme [Acidimicrobiales bacterium]